MVTEYSISGELRLCLEMRMQTPRCMCGCVSVYVRFVLLSIGFHLSHYSGGRIWELAPELDGCGGGRGVRFAVGVVDFASLLATLLSISHI